MGQGRGALFRCLVDDRTRWVIQVVTTRKRLRRYDIALIGIVLLACGIAVLAAAPRLGYGLPLAGALWSSAAATFSVARRPGRR